MTTFTLPDAVADVEQERTPFPFFVFGTLRPGYGNDRTWIGLADAMYDDQATIEDHRLVSNGGFPYCLPAEGETTTGTLIVPRPDCYGEARRRMDSLEGYPFHYNRKTVAVTTPEGVITAWYYIPDDWETYSLLRPVPGNNWRNARLPRDEGGYSSQGWWSS